MAHLLRQGGEMERGETRGDDDDHDPRHPSSTRTSMEEEVDVEAYESELLIEAPSHPIDFSVDDDEVSDAAPLNPASPPPSPSLSVSLGSTSSPSPSTSTTRTPLPKRQLALVCAAVFSTAFSWTMLYAFVAFMVYDFHMGETKEDVGYYSGFLASACYLAQFFAAFIWGAVADKKGRRPVLLIGVAADVISFAVLGLAPNYWIAFASRIIVGLFNCNVPVVKAYLGDITDNTNQARAFAFFGMMWGVGSVIGPVAGGLLCQPATKMPEIFSPDGIFGQYPYLLPCIVSVAISLVILILCFFLLPETLHLNQHRRMLEEEKEKDIEMKELVARKADIEEADGLDLVQSEEEGGEINEEREQGCVPLSVLCCATPRAEYLGVSQTSSINPLTWLQAKVRELIAYLWRYRLAVYSILIYEGFCLVFDTGEEVLPVWLFADPASGGLGFSSSQIGQMMLIGGIAVVIYQFFIYHHIAESIGAARTVTFGTVIATISFILFPFSNWLLSVWPEWAVLVYINAINIIKVCADSTCWTSNNLIVNMTAPDCTGKANGIAYTFAGLVRTIFPVGGTVLLAWSLSNGLGFPWNHYLVFFLLAVVMAIDAICSLFLPADLEARTAASKKTLAATASTSADSDAIN